MIAVRTDLEQRQHAQPQLLQPFIAAPQFVVILDACRQIRVQFPPAQQGRMPLDRQPRVQSSLDDLHHARAAVHDAHIIHDLGHADDAGPGEHLGHFCRAKVCPGGLLAGHCRHATGHW